MKIQLASTVSPNIKFDGELRISARVSIISNIIEKNNNWLNLSRLPLQCEIHGKVNIAVHLVHPFVVYKTSFAM